MQVSTRCQRLYTILLPCLLLLLAHVRMVWCRLVQTCQTDRSNSNLILEAGFRQNSSSWMCQNALHRGPRIALHSCA